MALTIATNLFALNAQNALSNTQQPLAKAQEQLSTGLKINNASDNAAGLAIATRMQLQINGYAQDVNNANNGVDFAQTAEGALTGMTNNLQRIYELANQSASYNTSSDRSAMNDEVQQLIAQLNSTVSQTEYNGSTFLNQAFNANFQVGNEVGQTINITTQNVAPNAFGVQTSRTDFTNTATNLANIGNAIGQSSLAIGSSANAAIASTATINGVSLGADIAATDAFNSSLTIINRINQYTAQTNVTAFSFGNADVGSAVLVASNGGSAPITTYGAGISSTLSFQVAAGYLTINGISIGSVSIAGATYAGTDVGAAYITAMVNAINNQTTQTGVTAEAVSFASASNNFGGSAAETIALVNTTGAAITVSVATTDVTVLASDGVTNVSSTWTGNVLTNASIAAGQNGQIVFSSPLGVTSVSLDSGNTAAALGLATTQTNISMTFNQSINNINVNTTGAANLAILSVEQGINTMNNSQAYLGAVVNRFSSAISELQSDSTNITAARSTFMDADYAASTSNLTTALITEQAGISMLAQANTLPQYILTLLPKT